MTNDRDARRSGLGRGCQQGLVAVRQYRAPWCGPSESGSSLEVSPTGRIQAGLMRSKIRQVRCVVRAFLPNQI